MWANRRGQRRTDQVRDGERQRLPGEQHHLPAGAGPDLLVRAVRPCASRLDLIFVTYYY
jgi:hypothetical protein